MGVGIGVLASGYPSTFPGIAAAVPSGRRVAVFGGGPGGMTAAHELAERGFSVDLYDANERLGGMVRSYSRTLPNGRRDWPMTCGGHFILPGYATIPEMMSRTPVGNGQTVLDRLVLTPHGRTGVSANISDLVVAMGGADSNRGGEELLGRSRNAVNHQVFVRNRRRCDRPERYPVAGE
ncbi:NAD(P)-binding protein [Gordonia zhenghanii]|nr:NAD(P)-binding protein [Gordonia zhenghanii]